MRYMSGRGQPELLYMILERNLKGVIKESDCLRESFETPPLINCDQRPRYTRRETLMERHSISCPGLASKPQTMLDESDCPERIFCNCRIKGGEIPTMERSMHLKQSSSSPPQNH